LEIRTDKISFKTIQIFVILLQNHLMKALFTLLCLAFFLLFQSCSQKKELDLLIHNALIYDGTGTAPFLGQVGVKGGKIVYVGEEKSISATTTLNAEGKTLTPGFINMLSWGYNNLLEDGRSLSDLKQGVTLEVFGEGTSPGPSGKKDSTDYESFGDAMNKLVQKGVSPNIASYLGATTVRILTVGYENRPASTEELEEMKKLVVQSMEEGALGIGSSLIYAPADYAPTEELITLCAATAPYGGRYISHIRNEDERLLESVNELIQIAKTAGVPAEIYHLKASRPANFHKLDQVIAKVDSARAAGLAITADIYTYNASSTGLTGVVPTWVQEGGHEAWMNRMRNPIARKRLLEDLRRELSQQPPKDILMVGFKNDSLAQIYRGKTIAEAAKMRNQSPEETVIDLILEDDSRIQCIYFSMSEENLRKKMQIPWVSFCSDAGTYSTWEADFRTHPRAFGSFIRVLSEFSIKEGLLSMESAIHRLTGLPAANLGLQDRGLIKEGYWADLVLFDPKALKDKATFDNPLQFAEGIEEVWVNGTQVLQSGEHTGLFPGQFVKGSGAKK
jgi:N-acyl-D-amino-acid deacylase